jgi:hypothetical protein
MHYNAFRKLVPHVAETRATRQKRREHVRHQYPMSRGQSS